MRAYKYISVLWEFVREFIRILISTIVDFLPMFASFWGVFFSVLHNLWASDYTKGFYFPFNPGRSIYFETHVYFAGDRITLCIAAAICIMLCMNRWSGLREMYVHAFKLLLILEAVTLIDYFLTGNKDLSVKEFDSNTIKCIVYGIYVGSYFIKRLFEKVKYATS